MLSTNVHLFVLFCVIIHIYSDTLYTYPDLFMYITDY